MNIQFKQLDLNSHTNCLIKGLNLTILIDFRPSIIVFLWDVQSRLRALFNLILGAESLKNEPNLRVPVCNKTSLTTTFDKETYVSFYVWSISNKASLNILGFSERMAKWSHISGHDWSNFKLPCFFN